MKKTKIIPLTLVFAMLTGCAGIKTDKFYIRACEDYINENSLSSYIITDSESPRVCLSSLPEMYYEISDDFIEAEEYHQVIFKTKHDAVLGPLIFYVDESGTVIGSGYRW
ncbi:MAG TPA: hypothetical protein DCO72_10895 [Ruminococcus sp.]|jgi:hypothetical protein|nr:hypothetical protein [Ruminococcus sp.]